MEEDRVAASNRLPSSTPNWSAPAQLQTLESPRWVDAAGWPRAVSVSTAAARRLAAPAGSGAADGGRYAGDIAALISAAIAISYFDRQTLPVAIKAIQHEIPISNTQFSQLQAAFLLAYALMYAGGGKLIDVLGTRHGFL